MFIAVIAQSVEHWATGWTIDWGSRLWIPAGDENFSLHHCVQNGSRSHTASYPMGTKDSFHGGKAVGVWSWPLTSI